MIRYIDWLRSAAGLALAVGVFTIFVYMKFISDGLAQSCDCDKCLVSYYYNQENSLCCRACYDNFPPTLWNSSESEDCYQTCQYAARPLCHLLCNGSIIPFCSERCYRGWVYPARKLCRRACPYGEDKSRTSRQRQQLLVKRNPASYASRATWLQVIQFILTFLLVILLFFVGLFQRTPKPFTAKLMLVWVESSMILVVLLVADMRDPETEDDVRYVQSFVLQVVLTGLMLWEVRWDQRIRE
uniref:Uncharacterized protein n=1 Tax=Lygus hesperus TaxID=30085 RepID=A0A0K8SCC1_LYGHE